MSTIVGGSLINGKALEEKLAKAFSIWSRFDLNDHFRDQFFEDKWFYGRDTTRKSGEPVSAGNRNIYDLGVLYKSGRDSFDLNDSGANLVASWNWDATNSTENAYALYVHDALEGSNVPYARPWTQDLRTSVAFEASTVKQQLLSRIRTQFGR